MEVKKGKITFNEGLFYLAILLTLFNFVYACGEKQRSIDIIKNTRKLNLRIDSLSKVVGTSDSSITLSKIENLIKLNGYQVSLRNLYHNNAIVRSKERPDDVMFLYNQRIDELEKKK